jgi:DeoR/GlpR family transcriptional regulator of sugar metabolism
MLVKKRQDTIFSILAERPQVTVKELSVLLGVSEVTIRKDLNVLENEGILKRTHGGAAQISSDSIEKRMLFRYNEKLKIAKEAVKLVEHGETLLIEAGSTNAVFAKELASSGKEVHIITNSLYLPRLVKGYGNMHVTVIGGNVQSEAEALVGPLAKLVLQTLYVNKAFIGMDGFSANLGFTCGDFLRAEIGREMSQRAEKVIILAESSKFNNTGVTSVVELSRIHAVISDGDLPEQTRALLQNHHIHTIIIDEESYS